MSRGLPSLPRFATSLSCVSCVSCVLALIVACSGAPGAADPDPITVSEASDVVGVADRGLDPSVVSVTNAWGGHCSGVLLASDVVLTARRCVVAAADPALCPAVASDIEPAPAAADPSTIHVYLGAPGSGATWASEGAAVLTSGGAAICGADLAVVVLAWPVEGVVASLVSEAGIAEGAYVRVVGLGEAPTADGESILLREHLPVLDVSASEIAVAEATCVADPGAVALDETTGEIVGVLSRWGSLCGAPQQYDVFTRADAFYGLVLDALAWEPSLSSVTLDGGLAREPDASRKRVAGKAKKPATDLGATCATAADCGTGLCVSAEGSQYCSRTCEAADTCPTDFRCVLATGGQSVCVES